MRTIVTLMILNLIGIADVIAATEVKYFDQKVSHSDPSDTRTFKQKYLINKDFASDRNAPVLFHVNGVNDLGTRYFDKYFNKIIVEKYRMNFVALEHRFYGESQPFDKLTNENLRHLNLQNAIEDLAYFQKTMREAGMDGPWIMLGGSYAGSLAAYFKVQYPDAVKGTISGCASPYRRQVSTEYDRITADVIGAACTRKYHEMVLSKIADAKGNQQQIERYKEIFKGKDIESLEGLLGYIGGNASFYVEIKGAKPFCDSLEQVDPISALAELLNKFNEEWNSVAVDWTPEGIQDLNPKTYSVGIGKRQWAYHSCTEMGNLSYFFDDLKRSMYHPMAHDWLRWEKQCGFFGIKEPPRVAETNRRFYEKLLSPVTRDILFLVNANDPVSQGAISKANGNTINPNTVSHTIENSAHCEELRLPKATDSKEVLEARELILSMVGRWIDKAKK